MTPPTYEEARKKSKTFLAMVKMGKSQLVREMLEKMMKKDKP